MNPYRRNLKIPGFIETSIFVLTVVVSQFLPFKSWERAVFPLSQWDMFAGILEEKSYDIRLHLGDQETGSRACFLFTTCKITDRDGAMGDINKIVDGIDRDLEKRIPISTEEVSALFLLMKGYMGNLQFAEFMVFEMTPSQYYFLSSEQREKTGTVVFEMR